jgi:hypothetical protein
MDETPKPAPTPEEDISDPRLGRLFAVDNGFVVGIGVNDRTYVYVRTLREAVELMLAEKDKPHSHRDTENGHMVVIDKLPHAYLLRQIVNNDYVVFDAINYNPDLEIQTNALVNAVVGKLTLKSARRGNMKIVGGDGVPN